MLILFWCRWQSDINLMNNFNSSFVFSIKKVWFSNITLHYSVRQYLYYSTRNSLLHSKKNVSMLNWAIILLLLRIMIKEDKWIQLTNYNLNKYIFYLFHWHKSNFCLKIKSSEIVCFFTFFLSTIVNIVHCVSEIN